MQFSGSADREAAALALAETVRTEATKMIQTTGWGFLGSCLSVADILAAIFTEWRLREHCDTDRLVFSKGHAAPALYAALLGSAWPQSGAYAELNSPLQGHPRFGTFEQVRATSGSLGLAMGFGIGEFIAWRREEPDSRLALIVGDGELQTGSAAEACLYLASSDLRGVVVIVDRNNRQSSIDPPVAPIQSMAAAFPRADFIDGHSIGSLLAFFRRFDSHSPMTFLVCRTRRGYGMDDATFETGPMGYIPPTAASAHSVELQEGGR